MARPRRRQPHPLWLAGAMAMLAPLPVLAADPVASTAAPFVPPEGAVVLSRTVWRDLPDGKTMRVTRSYTMTIRRQGSGFVVEGSLTGVTVDAPPALAPLAELERKRPDQQLFPIFLDHDGQIIDPPAAPAAAPGHTATREVGARLIGQAQLPAEQGARAAQVLDTVVASARTGAVWPRDLFNPRMAGPAATRTVTQGTTQVTITTTVDRAMGSPLPRAYERRVVTRFDGSESVTREQWTMAGPGPDDRSTP